MTRKNLAARRIHVDFEVHEHLTRVKLRMQETLARPVSYNEVLRSLLSDLTDMEGYSFMDEATAPRRVT